MATPFPYYLLPGEDRNEYEALAADYEQEFDPQSEHESFLVNQLIDSRWKLRRFERLQAEAGNQVFATAAEAQSPDAALVAALQTPNTAYERLGRFAAQAERTYHRAHRELTQLRRQHRKDQSQALRLRLDAIAKAPLPNEPGFEAWRAAFQNEPNPLASPLPARPASAILDSSWHEPGSQSC